MGGPLTTWPLLPWKQPARGRTPRALEPGVPGAGVAHRWSSRMRTDAQVRGGRAEMGRTTERRGEGALEGVREDGEGEENAKTGPQS